MAEKNPIEIQNGQDMSDLDLDNAWRRSMQRMRAELGEAIYNSWFARLELDYVANSILYCSVPTKFLKSWITSQFLERIFPIMASEFPGLKNISVSVRTSSRPPARQDDRHAAHSNMQGSEPHRTHAVPEARPPQFTPRSTTAFFSPQEAAKPGFNEASSKFCDIGGSNLDPRYTFENFLVGPSNQLAHAAAMEVARGGTSSGGASFNPLFFHASVGLGKTHLLQAIAHRATELRRRVVYLTAEKFMYTFVSSLKDQTTIAFKERLRSIDLLIIDDVQFLQGKSMQQEFSHTLNALFDAGRQVVAAADLPPSELESHDERLRSRLSGGLCIELKSFDSDLRHKIVENRVAAAKSVQPGFDVPPAVVSYVASVIQTNGRDIDGAVNRLLAHSTFSGARLTVETAESAIRDLIRVRDPKRVKIDDILKLVSAHYSVSKPDLLSSRRTAVVVRPRQVAMYLAKILTLRSLPEIGRRFGGRDHTTVLHAVRKIERLSRCDNSLRDELELLKRMLSE
jgi:chromosomal replication initiator protein